jgi:hypothetical protein
MSRKVWLTAGTIVAAIADAFLHFSLQSPTAGRTVAMLLPVDPARLVVETKTGEQSHTIEIADSEAERERGLMFRETMDEGHGMLFVFEATQQMAFWMRNTPLPLDMVFIGQDGGADIRHGEFRYSALSELRNQNDTRNQ